MYRHIAGKVFFLCITHSIYFDIKNVSAPFARSSGILMSHRRNDCLFLQYLTTLRAMTSLCHTVSGTSSCNCFINDHLVNMRYFSCFLNRKIFSNRTMEKPLTGNYRCRRSGIDILFIGNRIINTLLQHRVFSVRYCHFRLTGISIIDKGVF